MTNDGIKYLATIAIPARFFPGYNLDQFEIVVKKGTIPTLSMVQAAAKSRDYKNFIPVGVIQIGPTSIKETVENSIK